MAEGTTLQYMLFPLTVEETERGASSYGYLYAKQNQSRWINITDLAYELQTYDRALTYPVLGGVPYMIHKDFAVLDDHVRLYIGKRYDNEHDVQKIGSLNGKNTIVKTWEEMITAGAVTVTNGTAAFDTTKEEFFSDILIIPGTITKIGSPTVKYQTTRVKAIIISDGTKEIENEAFSGFHCMQISIPTTVSMIGVNAFSHAINVYYKGLAAGAPWGAASMN